MSTSSKPEKKKLTGNQLSADATPEGTKRRGKKAFLKKAERVSIILTHAQVVQLRERAGDREVSVSHLLREIVDKALDHE